MSTNTISSRLRPHPETIIAGGILIGIEFLSVVVYLLLTSVIVTQPEYYVYPFIWINIALWALWRVNAPEANARRRLVAAAIAVGYFLVLGYVGGLYGPGIGARATGLRIAVLGIPPGWGPALLYSGAWIRLALLPFKVIGYLVLAYLVYVTVLDTTGSAAVGLIGLFSCVSCTLPFIAAAVSGFLGGVSALVALASAQSYRLSTAVFVLTILLLVWRPSAGSFSRLRAKLG